MTPSTREQSDESREADVTCYRCKRTLESDRAIHLSAAPGPATDARYAPTTDACCPSCAAGIGLLAVVPLSSGRD